MNKIINGKRYDTEKAQKIYYSDNGHMTTDFEYCAETLYRKKTGEFFLYCEGGPNSRYGEWHGNTGGWGEQLKPLSFAQADTWAQENMTADEYSKVFEISEDESTELVGVRMEKSVADKLRRMAAMEAITLGEVIKRLLADK